MPAVGGRFAPVRVHLTISATAISAFSAVPRLVKLAATAMPAVRLAGLSAEGCAAVIFRTARYTAPGIAAGAAGFSEPKVCAALLSPQLPARHRAILSPGSCICAGVFPARCRLLFRR